MPSLVAVAVMIFDVWLQQWAYPGWGARLLRDGQGRFILQKCRNREPVQHSSRCPVGSRHLGLRFVPVWYLRAIARISGFRCADVLHLDDPGSFYIALPEAGYGTTVPSFWLPGTPRVISLARLVPRTAIVALQAAIHLARIDDHFIGCAGLLALAKVSKGEIAKKSRNAEL